MRLIPSLSLFALALSSTVLAAPNNPTGSVAPPEPRWTAQTPDEMIDLAKSRALTAGLGEHEAIAAMAAILQLSSRAEYGHASRALEEIAKQHASAEVRGEAALAARLDAADEGSSAGVDTDKKLGVATNLALVGPFRDTGGGLDRREGPEEKNESFANREARYAWGSIDVGWRRVPESYAAAQGVPLDVFIHPRKESCSIVATKVTTTATQTFVVRLAASGQARLMFDGVEVGKSDDVHAAARFDRIAAKVEAQSGPHLVAAKVCSGALADEGRVRIRFTDEKGAPLALVTSAELPDLKSISKPKTEKLSTALGRAIAPAKEAGPIAQLDAAIARTLGGADDLKSPRAPGVLAALVKGGSLDADHLAMAGWVAPSGANRSAWLNLARDKASADHDAKTQAFVERRLVAQHLQGQMADWAMAARRTIKLDDQKDSEAVTLAALVDESLGTEALRLGAMHRLAAQFDVNPRTAPTILVRKLADLSAGPDPQRAATVFDELGRRGDQGIARVQALVPRGKDAMVRAAKEAFDGGLADADEGIAVAHAISRTGAHEAARDLFGVLVRWAPNRADSWAGLAEELAATNGTDPAAQGVVAAALRRALDLAPSEARYRAELALRQKAGGEAERHDDEKYIVPSQTILARRQGVPQGAPDVADRELYWLRAVVMHSDKRVSQLIQYAREIVIPPRTQDELFEEIPSEGELTEILRARVHRKDGGTAFPTEEHNEARRPRIRWPELMPGDTVEVAIRTWTGGPVGGRGDPPFYFLDYAGSISTHPLLFNEVVVESTPQFPIFVDVINGAAEKKDEKDENGRHVVRLKWERPMTVADEPLAPHISEVVPMIVGSTFKDWNAFRAWYGEAVRGFTEPDEEVKQLAAQLTKNKRTREEKLQAIFNFVADDIRYVNYVSGEWWLPNRPQQLLARREGDCDDKAILLITLLRSVGIEAQEVLVQTRLTNEPSILRAKGAAIPLFDHGIAFLPGPNGGTYLDATSPQSRLGPLPSMDARAAALRMDGPPEIVALPASSPDDHGADVDWTITLGADGSGDLAGEERHRGDGAFWLRTYLTEEGARLQYVEDRLVGGWFPTVAVDKQIEFKGDLANGAAWVKYKAHSDGLARHEQNDLVVPLSQSATLASQLAPLVKRTLPVSLPPYLAPTHEARTIRVIAPHGFKWADLPPGGDEAGGEFGRAHLDVTKDTRDPRAVIVKRTLVFDMSVIPVEKYAAWRAWIQRVDALMHKGVRLVGDTTVAMHGVPRGGR